MAIYKNYKELKGHILEFDDIVIFRDLEYTVHHTYLSHLADNDEIFSILDINKVPFCEKEYRYPPRLGIFPECKIYDFEALTRVALALFKECERQNPEMQDIDEKIDLHPDSLYKVGDIVTILSEYRPGTCGSDYMCHFTTPMLRSCGGNLVQISKVTPASERKCHGLNTDKYIYKTENWSFSWSAEMFRETWREVDKIKTKLEFPIGSAVLYNGRETTVLGYSSKTCSIAVWVESGHSDENKQLVDAKGATIIPPKDHCWWVCAHDLRLVDSKDEKLVVDTNPQSHFLIRSAALFKDRIINFGYNSATLPSEEPDGEYTSSNLSKLYKFNKFIVLPKISDIQIKITKKSYTI